jgi:hypothetical protein
MISTSETLTRRLTVIERIVQGLALGRQLFRRYQTNGEGAASRLRFAISRYFARFSNTSFSTEIEDISFGHPAQ